MEEEYSNKSSTAGNHQHRHPPASTTELMESAKLMAAAAKSAMGGDVASINKARVAEAAEGLIGAAEKYGKLEGSGVGSYLDKAEDYLHKYHDSSRPTESAAAHGENAAPHSRPQPHRRQEEDEEEPQAHRRPQSHRRQEGDEEEPHAHRRQEEDEEEPRHGSGGSGGIGDYMKMAQGFFK